MKTATELGITSQEHAALLAVRDDLAGGRLPHRPPFPHPVIGRAFNMLTSGASYSCGTVACIGGWMHLKMHEPDPANLDDGFACQYVGAIRSEPLEPLFHPPMTFDWDDITTEQAVRAIDNFLATGDPGWDAILST